MPLPDLQNLAALLVLTLLVLLLFLMRQTARLLEVLLPLVQGQGSRGVGSVLDKRQG